MTCRTMCATCLTASAQASEKSQGLSIKISGYKYNRVEALATGDVEVKGCETTFEVDVIGYMDTHVFSGPQTRAVFRLKTEMFDIVNVTPRELALIALLKFLRAR